MYSFFVGCDMSKAFFDAAFYQDQRVLYAGQFSNDKSGYKAFVRELKKHTCTPTSSWFICFENTGVYSKSLLEWLCSQNIPCREENALQISRSMGLRRGKNDKIDALDICRYTFEKRASIQTTHLPNPLIMKLKKLLSRRDFLVRQKQSLMITLKDQSLSMDPELFAYLNACNERLIDEYTTQIKDIEQRIDPLMHQNGQMDKNYGLAQSVVGIGKITAAYMIAVTENFTCFKNGRKFACYSGTAPFPNQSGSRIGKTKVSHLANKKIKSLLSNCVNAAIMYDKELALYYQKKMAEGKHKGIVINAIKNKLIHRVFAVINRQSPYVKIMNYAS